jgi:hypothetical protein
MVLRDGKAPTRRSLRQKIKVLAALYTPPISSKNLGKYIRKKINLSLD